MPTLRRFNSQSISSSIRFVLIFCFISLLLFVLRPLCRKKLFIHLPAISSSRVRRVSPFYSYRYLLNYSYFLLLIRFLKMICHFLFVAVTYLVFYLFLLFGFCHFNPSFLRDIKRGRSLTWRQCLLASQPMCWSCGGSGSAEASRSAFKVRAASAECRALNHTLASALSAALNQHSCTPSGECSSRIRPSESRNSRVRKSFLSISRIILLFYQRLITFTLKRLGCYRDTMNFNFRFLK